MKDGNIRSAQLAEPAENAISNKGDVKEERRIKKEDFMSSTRTCTICGGTEFVKSGTKLSREGRWQVYQCKGCGHKQRGELLASFHSENGAENILRKTTEVNDEQTDGLIHQAIKEKERAISLPYQGAKPSEVTDNYWIYAKGKIGGKHQPLTPRSGKWLIFVDIENIDEVWAKVEKAYKEGKLGPYAKVATAKPNPNATNPETKVICVYTYDWTDEEDVKRVREELRKIGIINKIPYKANEDTRSGKYRITGHTRISKYYE
ncbi:MAG: putative phosphothreonine lyase domain-containing protein [Candidatus Methanoperedens sp.]